MAALDEHTDWDTAFTEVYRRTHEQAWTAEETTRQALAAAGLAGVAPGDRVLDCPCGFGRHAQALAEHGYHVTGVDRSPDLLAEAQRRRAAGAAFPAYQRGDYRELPFPDRSFDAVLCLWSSLGYLDRAGDQTVLSEFRRVLRPGGTLVLELMHRDAYVTTYTPRTWQRLPDDALYLKERVWEPVTGKVTTEHTLIEPDHSQRAWTTAHRFSSATEWTDMLNHAGFGTAATYAGLSTTPLRNSWLDRAVFAASA